MRRKNRMIGMIVCLLILLTSAIVDLLFFGQGPVLISLLFGFAVGWALRESLQPLEKEKEE